jgi:hypothetical protein
MPRAHRGRSETLNHFVLGDLSMFGLFLAVARRRVHWFLAIVVRWKVAVRASHIARMKSVRRSLERGAPYLVASSVWSPTVWWYGG